MPDIAVKLTFGDVEALVMIEDVPHVSTADILTLRQQAVAAMEDIVRSPELRAMISDDDNEADIDIRDVEVAPAEVAPLVADDPPAATE